MQLTIQRLSVLLLLTLALIFASASTAFAEDVSAEASVSAEAKVEAGSGGKPRPLQLLNNVRTNIKDKAQRELREIKVETRADLKTASSSAEKRAILQDAKEGRKEIRGDMKERLQVLLRTHLGSAIARLNAAVRHFDNIIERIESRIEKLKDRGLDTASVEATLKVAMDAAAVAKVDVQALSSVGASITASSTAETVKTEIRTAVKKAMESVKVAHQALLKTSRELSALVKVSAQINSTTTVDTNN